MNILYCRVGWMNYYQGMENDSISGGEKYIKENEIGGEIYNFQCVEGTYYGYVEPGTHLGKPRKISVNRFSGSDEAHDVLVLWVSSNKIIGWYENADVFASVQTIPQGVMEYRDAKTGANLYNIKAKHAVLLPPDCRKFQISGMGKSQLWYGNDETNQKVIDYIEKHTQERDEQIASIANMELLCGEEFWKYTKQRVNQDVFRNALLKKSHCCCLCGVSMESCLIASHIKPWRDSTPEEKLDVNNGLLLCPNHDKLFDTGLISFDETGRIMISPHLEEQTRINMNVETHMNIQLTDMNAFYLAYHRDHIYQK